MSKPILREGPRITVCIDVNLQWLRPKFHGADGLYYLHLGWLSAMFGVGKARDAFWDALDRGLGMKPDETQTPEDFSGAAD